MNIFYLKKRKCPKYDIMAEELLHLKSRQLFLTELKKKKNPTEQIMIYFPLLSSSCMKLREFYLSSFAFNDFFNKRKIKENRDPECTVNSKINGTPKAVHLPIPKLHSISVVANLLAHNNISYVQINSVRLK